MICILVTAGSCPQSQIKGTKGKMVLARVIDHHTREGRVLAAMRASPSLRRGEEPVLPLTSGISRA